MSSGWQQRIEGDWHGLPSVFSADGAHAGFIKVNRSSVVGDGKTTYLMDTALDVGGPLRARFEARAFAFGVLDGEHDRVYMGPDFFGAGHPWGSVVDAHYYSPAWQADLRTLVHILPDGKTQAYSSQLYEGPTLIAVFNGLYTNAPDHAESAATQARVAQFLDEERHKGTRPHVLPFKLAGTWSGLLTLCDETQQPVGSVTAQISYRPLTLLRAAVAVELSGAIDRKWRYERSRQGHHHTFDGPDIWGNAIGYGRALYISQHVTGRAQKLTGREFLLDDNFTLSVVWRLHDHDRLEHMVYGCLRWEPSEQVLQARY